MSDYVAALTATNYQKAYPAAVDAGRIPDQILKDTELAAHLPAFIK